MNCVPRAIASAEFSSSRLKPPLANRVLGCVFMQGQTGTRAFLPLVSQEKMRYSDGEIPRGYITEVNRAAPTGRLAFALSIVSSITQPSASCA